jgi:biotin synthase
VNKNNKELFNYLINELNSFNDNTKLNSIFVKADKIRKKTVGDILYLRGIIEISNYCKKNCYYCGLRGNNKKIIRYRMKENEILKTALAINNSPIKTIVLQSGEDEYWTKEKMGELIKKLKKKTGLVVTLSLGVRDYETYQYWKNCGADRYLIRFETSNRVIFKKIHPDEDFDKRLECIKNLKNIGYETGSGFMIGLPETNFEDIANDIILCKELKLDMVGIGPFIPNPDTPLKKSNLMYGIDFITLIFSLLRISMPEANIPATTAVDTIDKNGRMLTLQRGANVFMPNITPTEYRNNYLL